MENILHVCSKNNGAAIQITTTSSKSQKHVNCEFLPLHIDFSALKIQYLLPRLAMFSRTNYGELSSVALNATEA